MARGQPGHLRKSQQRQSSCPARTQEAVAALKGAVLAVRCAKTKYKAYLDRLHLPIRTPRCQDRRKHTLRLAYRCCGMSTNCIRLSDCQSMLVCTDLSHHRTSPKSLQHRTRAAGKLTVASGTPWQSIGLGAWPKQAPSDARRASS